MPKHAVHVYVLDSVISKLSASEDPRQREIGAVMRRNRSAAVLGSFGPDLHVWAPDYLASSALLQFLSNLKRAVDRYNELAGTIGRCMDTVEVAGGAGDAGGAGSSPAPDPAAIEKIRSEYAAMLSAISPELFEGIVDGYDFFADPGRLQPMIDGLLGDTAKGREGPKTMADFPWSDRLHFWHAGHYARNLLQASRDETSRAYAYGFLTHIAADLVVHQLVRKAIGGAYSRNPQGHFVCESYLDAWSYFKRCGQPLNGHMVCDFGLEDDDKGEMSDSVARVIRSALMMTYGSADGLSEDYPSEDSLKATYRRIRQYYLLQDGLRPAKPRLSRHAPEHAGRVSADAAAAIASAGDFRTALGIQLSGLGSEGKRSGGEIDDRLRQLNGSGRGLTGPEAAELLYEVWVRAYHIISATLSIAALLGMTIPEPELIGGRYVDRLLCVRDADMVERGPDYYISGRPFSEAKIVGYVDAVGHKDPIVAGDDADLGNAVDLATWMIARSDDPEVRPYVFANWAMESEDL